MSDTSAENQTAQVQAPAITQPKGGGAIRGIGEKFAANPVTGTGSMTVPIATSPGRQGFGPQLTLSYDSGRGNGVFGFGWAMSTPSITRKTDKGLPRYDDQTESDVFILSDAEDLVPVLRTDGTRDRSDTIAAGYTVDRYRPRVEGSFARIERWTRLSDGDVHWRSISRDNVLTLYGASPAERIADPADPSRVFTWLISESRDDRGNAIRYEYKPDDGVGVDLTRLNERNRGGTGEPGRAVNRYLKRIRYGNATTLLDADGNRPPILTDAQTSSAEWLFEVVFDYGDHDTVAPSPDDTVDWLFRRDPFSSYRAGFEVRTTRLCRRVLMFHHFPDPPGGQGYDGLVRSTDFTYSDGEEPNAVGQDSVYTFLREVTQVGYRWEGAGYATSSMPPVEFEYTRPVVQTQVEVVDDLDSLANLPAGLAGPGHQWIDLHGEGTPGVLIEQTGAWFYKLNLSPIGRGSARFAPMQSVAQQPTAQLAGGQWQFLDLAGDGRTDLVELDGPTPGLYEHDGDRAWEPFRPFTSRVNIDARDPNLRFVDLNGDGLADVLITDDEALVWHPSLGEAGFDRARRVPLPLDEEHGPRVVFADGTESIHLADLSGDGLADLVRIRNGSICYWPNLGYGAFGAKVTMDNAPWFDRPDMFGQNRIRLADIDGSGTTDIIYLHGDGVRLYFNESGNGWTAAHVLNVFPRVDDLVSITVTDLLGNGTACLVWSSPLPCDAGRPMRYVNLMGKEKPHLLVRTANNLGAETRVHYAPSTKFCLQDKLDGRPWITRLPFPVYVVETVETYDYLSRNRFVTRHAYHHGHFDGEEREFRGFGMVEQWDTEQIAALTTDGTFPHGDNIDSASHVPPVHTKTWFHTGVHPNLGVSRQFEHEYFREPGLTLETARPLLLEDTALPTGLTAGEDREACRALKGSMLRQEVYADDAHPGATVDEIASARTPYTVIEQNFSIRTLQPCGSNRHAVFLTHPREAITYHYERKPADPRIQHTLTLEVDAYGNALKQAAVGYGRRTTVTVIDAQGEPQQAPNPGLTALYPADQAKQTTALLTYTENSVTNAVDLADTRRNPMPCEAITFELTGYVPTGPDGRFQASDLVEPDPAAPDRVSHRVTAEVPYEATATDSRCRRPIEQVRTLYRADDLSGLLPLGELQTLALPGESYKLAFTSGLLDQVFQRPHQGQATEPLLPDPAAVLGGQAGDQGGYLPSQTLKSDGHFPATDADDHWWLPSGRSFYSSDPADAAATELADARQHFFLPRRYRDPFGHDAVVDFDTNDLLIVETRDAVGNRVTVDICDYRVLQPRLVSDPNRNQTEVVFDTLGMVVGTAIMGKPLPARVEGDSLQGFATDVPPVELAAFLDAVDPHSTAPTLLQNATTRIVYDLDRFRRTRQANPGDPTQWQPARAATLARETHASETLPPHGLRIQVAFSYSDGFGHEIQKKLQAEPGPVVEGGPVVCPRWVGTGWTILNNKGKPVRQYEPFFTATHRFEFGVTIGVSPVLFYDPAGRVIATLYPNHTYDKFVLDPWQQTTYDVNDTCAPRNRQTGDPRTDPDIQGCTAGYFTGLADNTSALGWQTWHAQRIGGALGPHEQTAAIRAEAHADTPTTVHVDTLGRPFLTVTRNRVMCTGHDLDDTEDDFPSRVELDIEGNQRAVRDAVEQAGDPLGRIVMLYAYDLLGNRIHQLSMEAGARWTISDVTGKTIRKWDSRGHNFITRYDKLRRPVEKHVRGTTTDSDPRVLNRDLVFEKIEYGEPLPNASPAAEQLARTLSLRTRIYRHFDSAGVATNARLDANDNPDEAYDFKGNPLHTRRQLVSDYAAIPDWSQNPQLDTENFQASTRFDALNRQIQSIAPHSSFARAKRNIIQHVFNEANLLDRIDVWLDRSTEPDGLINPSNEAPSSVGVTNIDYDAKGQHQRIDYKNGASTSYSYDLLTYRLTRIHTRRGPAFTGDCDNPQSPPPVVAAPEKPPQGKYCGLQKLHYTYDPAGNITHIHDEAQQTIYFRNRRVEPSNDYTYDAVYRLIHATGREHLGQESNGTTLAPTAPDAFNAFHARLNHPGDGNAMGTYTERYMYDAVGNILKTHHLGTDPVHSGWTRTYRYTETSLIDNGIVGAPERSVNRLTGTTFNADAAHPLMDAYQHDAHGNMIRMPHLGGGVLAPNMHWNYEDRLCQTDLGGGGTTFYLYDARGERIRKVSVKAPGLTEERIYLAGFEIFRRHSVSIGSITTTIERETLHVNDGEQRIALVETRTLDVAGTDQAPAQLARYQAGNHLGSTSLELDSEARIISYEEYSSYGSTTYQATRSQTETTKRYRFTSKERDDESGLYYHRARYYVSWLGRWTACDPAGFVDSLSLCVYVSNNPIRLTDATGMQDSSDDEEGGMLRMLRAARLSEPGQFIGGLVSGGLSAQVPGGFLIAPLAESRGAMQNLPSAYIEGYAAGEMIVGAWQIASGLKGELGGALLDVTGFGAPVGVAANVMYAGLLAQGTGNVVAGFGIFMEARGRKGEGPPKEADRTATPAGEGGGSVPSERLRKLGEDPAGRFRQSEMETAARIEEKLGIQLERSTDPRVDWIDPTSGKTYDAVGNFDAKFFEKQWPSLQERIVDHLAKADAVPIDVSKFTSDQVAKVKAFIQDLGPRTFLVGE